MAAPSEVYWAAWRGVAKWVQVEPRRGLSTQSRGVAAIVPWLYAYGCALFIGVSIDLRRFRRRRVPESGAACYCVRAA